jgi:hypothetical protein
MDVLVLGAALLATNDSIAPALGTTRLADYIAAA